MTTGERLIGHNVRKLHGHPSMTQTDATPRRSALGLERAPFTDKAPDSAVAVGILDTGGRRKARPPDRPYTPENTALTWYC